MITVHENDILQEGGVTVMLKILNKKNKIIAIIPTYVSIKGLNGNPIK